MIHCRKRLAAQFSARAQSSSAATPRHSQTRIYLESILDLGVSGRLYSPTAGTAPP